MHLSCVEPPKGVGLPSLSREWETCEQAVGRPRLTAELSSDTGEGAARSETGGSHFRVVLVNKRWPDVEAPVHFELFRVACEEASDATGHARDIVAVEGSNGLVIELYESARVSTDIGDGPQQESSGLDVPVLRCVQRLWLRIG